MDLSSIRAAGWTGASIVVGSAMLLGLAGCGGAPPVSATPSPELQGMIEQKAEAAAPESQAVGALFRGVGYRKGEFQDFHVELEAGNCYWFVAAGDPGITAFTLTVWDGSKDEVGQDKSKSREALVEHCPKKTGTFKFQGKVGRGAGHFAIGLFAKAAPEDAAPVEEGPKKADLEQMITDEASSVAPEATQVGNFYKTN